MSALHARLALCLATSITFAAGLATKTASAQQHWATINPAKPYVGIRAYVTSNDHLHEVRRSGPWIGSWVWSDLGAPPLAGVSGVPLADPYDSTHARIFVTGKDGHLYLNDGDDVTRVWSDLGSPPSTLIHHDPARFAGDDRVMVIASNGSLYLRGPAVGDEWINLGHPEGVQLTGTPANTALVHEIFVTGSDGGLYRAKWSSSGSDYVAQWTNVKNVENAPAGVRGSPTVVGYPTYNPSGAIVYVRGTDDHLHVYREGTHEWLDHGEPGAASIHTSPVAVAFGVLNPADMRSFVFAGCDPNPPGKLQVDGSRSLCLDRSDLSTYDYTWEAFPLSGALIYGIPAIFGWSVATLDNTNEPLRLLTLFKTFDQHVHAHYWYGNDWADWDLGAPQ